MISALGLLDHSVNISIAYTNVGTLHNVWIFFIKTEAAIIKATSIQ